MGIVLVAATVVEARRSSHSEPRPAAPVAQKPAHLRAEGRLAALPGADVTVGTDMGGKVARVLVEERAVVKKGEPLVELDAAVERASLEEARARLSEAEADLALATREHERAKRLSLMSAGSLQAVDHAEHDRDAAAARRALAAATAKRLDAVVKKARIVSPIDGVVLSRLVEAGETVPPGARLVRVADLSRTRIEAEVDESDAGALAVGRAARITAEGWPEAGWRGRVVEIPDAVTGRRLKPEDPGRPSDTRVLVVKVALDEKTPLKLGQRVEIELDAR
jgi:RND family efflux transporter MFP subunit